LIVSPPKAGKTNILKQLANSVSTKYPDVHLIIARGTLSLLLAEQAAHTYPAGTIVAVPFGMMMEARSAGPEPLEFFAVKAPHPDAWPL
jgi:stage III sporulation protein SpoIIIAA